MSVLLKVIKPCKQNSKKLEFDINPFLLNMKIKTIVHLDKIDSCFLILIQYILIEKPQCYRFLFAKTDQLPPHLYIDHVLC